MFLQTDLSGIYELKLGGLVYFVGVFFFKSDGRIPFAHALWHAHVTLATIIHLKAVGIHLYGIKDWSNSVI